jgi:hypothetical protein
MLEKKAGWRVGQGLMRAGLAAALVGVYVVAGRPARVMLTERVALPALRAVDTQRAASFSVERAGRLMIRMRRDENDAPSGFRAPAGTLWLVPAMMLIALCPRRPYWAYLWLLHLGLGLLSVAALAAGLAWGDAGFVANGFLRAYAIPAVSFAAPVLMWRQARRRAGNE